MGLNLRLVKGQQSQTGSDGTDRLFLRFGQPSHFCLCSDMVAVWTCLRSVCGCFGSTEGRHSLHLRAWEAHSLTTWRHQSCFCRLVAALAGAAFQLLSVYLQSHPMAAYSAKHSHVLKYPFTMESHLTKHR